MCDLQEDSIDRFRRLAAPVGELLDPVIEEVVDDDAGVQSDAAIHFDAVSLSALQASASAPSDLTHGALVNLSTDNPSGTGLVNLSTGTVPGYESDVNNRPRVAPSAAPSASVVNQSTADTCTVVQTDLMSLENTTQGIPENP